MLSEKLKNNITSGLKKIENGNFDYDTICSLFINLRDALRKEDKKGYEVLYDIFDSVAHNDRNRGIIFEYSKDIINSFISAIKSGGIVSAKLVNPKLDEALANIFTFLNIPYDKALLDQQISKIRNIICNNILKDTKLCINNNDIESCSIVQSADNFLFVSFKMKPFCYTHNGLTIQGSPTMRFRLM